MRFLADMGVSIKVVQWLLQNGHDAKHLRDEGLHQIATVKYLQKPFPKTEWL